MIRKLYTFLAVAALMLSSCKKDHKINRKQTVMALKLSQQR